jgi:hypothetical protein
MKKTSKKSELELKLSTIRVLAGGQLAGVHGGRANAACQTGSCNVSNCGDTCAGGSTGGDDTGTSGV